MKIVLKNVSVLRCAKYNPRSITPDQEKALTDSIKKFGIVDPFIVNVHRSRKNFIIGGHRRLDVAKKLNISEVPCVEVNLTLAEEKELNIRLNKNNGEWNIKLLKEYFDVEDLLAWGFQKKELDFNVAELIDKGGRTRKVRSNVEVQFQFGELRFTVPQDVYVKWMDNLAREVGMKKQRQIDRVKKLLRVQ